MANRYEYKLEFTADSENIRKVLELITKHLQYALIGDISEVKTTVTILDGTLGGGENEAE